MLCVNMAIECLDESIRMFGPNIYVYHEIVHNKYVVDRFARQGVTFVEDVAQVPEGSLLLYSAHGVSPQIRAEARARRLQTIDATCAPGDQGAPSNGSSLPAKAITSS